MIKTPEILARKYIFLDFLGEGSNGKTWRAKTTLKGEPVAIKSLKLSKIENLKSLDLFQREAEVLSSISVHGVPKFYETIMDTDESGECYLIQQYIAAPSIQSYLDNGRKFSEDEALLLMRKIADILRQLEMNYKPPIIHRDIKPSNILCMMPDAADITTDIEPWLIDFGAVANPQKRQQGSTVAGTIGYMAPEQILGDNTIQADYYALGATILHMLTGVPPYQIPNELFVLKFKPVIEQNAPQTSANMIELLDILLQKEPELRPKDIDELTQYIDNVMQKHPPKTLQIQQTSFMHRLGKFFNQIALSFKTGNQSAQTQGYITGMRKFPRDVRDYLEFTYVIQNHYFTNAEAIPYDVAQNYKDKVFPIDCTIRYDPDNYALSSIPNDELVRIFSTRTPSPKETKQNIPSILFKPDSYITDPNLKTPPGLPSYTLLGKPSNEMGWVAKDVRTQEIVNIVPFIFCDETASYYDLFSQRVELYSTPIVGLPKIYQTLADPEQPTTYLIREYISAPPLRKFINANVKFYENQVLFCLLKIAHILKELQEHDSNAFLGGIHPDFIHFNLEDVIKTNQNATIWLDMFFISSNFHMHDNVLPHTTCSFGYIPPELLLDRPTPTSDVYVLGAVAVEMLTNVSPIIIPTQDFKLEIDPIIEANAPRTTAPMRALLHLLLKPNADERPNPDKVITYIKDVMNGYFPGV